MSLITHVLIHSASGKSLDRVGFSSGFVMILGKSCCGSAINYWLCKYFPLCANVPSLKGPAPTEFV